MEVVARLLGYNYSMDWIYLSPHLDDVALSVGGLLWEQSQAGERVSLWTICGGDPPEGEFSPFAESLHRRWGVGRAAMQERRAEDIESCAHLGVDYHHFDIPDCIYRTSPQTDQHLYAAEESLWVPVHPDEQPLIDQLCQDLRAKLPPDANLVCPLALGDHVDHRLTRAAAEKLNIPLWFYADYPYVLETGLPPELENWKTKRTPISPRGLVAWQEAVAAHRSQISTFWENPSQMKTALQTFCEGAGGVRLWKK